jgi:hypothetical protein
LSNLLLGTRDSLLGVRDARDELAALTRYTGFRAL